MILATTAKNSKVGQDSGTFRIFLALTIVEFSTERLGTSCIIRFQLPVVLPCIVHFRTVDSTKNIDIFILITVKIYIYNG